MARKKVQPCRHCGKTIPFPEPKPGALRASRPKFCSAYCRLYSKVNLAPGQGPEGECWEYQGAKHKWGYGMINMSESKASEVTTTHTVSWEVENGPIPEGLFVCHRCDNPPCCRPSHLFLGTHQDNMDDMKEKARTRVGEQHAMSKLTDQDVIAILRESGSDRAVALKYGVSHHAIQKIRGRVTWKHVT